MRDDRKFHGPDDQWALAVALRRLSARGCISLQGGTPLRGRCPSPLRLGHLSESFAALKSVDKRRLGFFPRYTRPIQGPALATHARRPFPWTARQDDMCALLNQRPGTRRLVLQVAASSPAAVVTRRNECLDALAHTASRVRRIATPLCSMLGVDALPPPASPLSLVEQRARTVPPLPTATTTSSPPLSRVRGIVESVPAFWTRVLAAQRGVT